MNEILKIRTHNIKLFRQFEGSEYECLSWICTDCQRGPFKPAIVCTGEFPQDFRVVSGPLHKREALALKAKLNLGYNQAVYYCMNYEDYLLWYRYPTNVVPEEPIQIESSMYCLPRGVPRGGR